MTLLKRWGKMNPDRWTPGDLEANPALILVLLAAYREALVELGVQFASLPAYLNTSEYRGVRRKAMHSLDRLKMLEHLMRATLDTIESRSAGEPEFPAVGEAHSWAGQEGMDVVVVGKIERRALRWLRAHGADVKQVRGAIVVFLPLEVFAFLRSDSRQYPHRIRLKRESRSYALVDPRTDAYRRTIFMPPDRRNSSRSRAAG